MVGFAKEAIAGDTDFEVRMEREKRIADLTAKRAKRGSTGLRGVQTAEQSDSKVGLKAASVAAVAGLMFAVAQSASAGGWH